MNFIKGYTCTLCHRHYEPDDSLFVCPQCGDKGILEVEFDYPKMKSVVNRSYFSDNHDYSMWRYAPLMGIPTEHIHAMLRVGWTPLYRSFRLGPALGITQLYIKDEGLNPSGSTKDRASGVAVLKAIAQGKTTIACSSTGNAASSLACQAAHMGLQAVIFVPKRAPIGKLTQLSIYGSTLITVDGDYKDTYDLSRKAIAEHGWYNRNAAINPHLVEGKKTVALEIAEQLDFKPTDWVAISVGDGCSIAGVYKGFYDLMQLGLISKIPRLLGVQSEGCCPFYTASITQKPLAEAEENTLADSIAVGIPRNPIKAQNAVTKSHGEWIAVSDEQILQSMAKLGKMEGIFGEPAGVAALAGIEKAISQGIIKPNETVTMIMTGNGLKDPANAQKAISPPILIKPDIALLNRYLKEKGVK